jgi:hypothetical protein
VAVSNPSRVHLRRGVDALGIAAQDAVHDPSRVELAFELGVVVPALSHLPADPDDGEEDDEIEQANEVQEGPGDGRADDAGPVMQRGRVVLDRSVQRPYPEVEEDGEDEDDRRVAERDEVPDAQGSLSVLNQLPRRVVDRCDVIGIEGVPHPQRVGEDPGPEAEELGLVDVVVTSERQEEHAPACDIEADHGRRHKADPGPFPRCQAVANLADPTGRSCRGV